MLNVSIADHIASLKIPRKMPTSKVTFSILLLSLIGYMYRRQLYILLDILNMDGSILYRFLAYIAVWGSFHYLRYFIKQLSNPGKKDFSLTSPYMQNALSLSKLFTFVCILCIHEIMRYFKDSWGTSWKSEPKALAFHLLVYLYVLGSEYCSSILHEIKKKGISCRRFYLLIANHLVGVQFLLIPDNNLNYYPLNTNLSFKELGKYVKNICNKFSFKK
jgi:hypothetical protein